MSGISDVSDETRVVEDRYSRFAVQEYKVFQDSVREVVVRGSSFIECSQQIGLFVLGVSLVLSVLLVTSLVAFVFSPFPWPPRFSELYSMYPRAVVLRVAHTTVTSAGGVSSLLTALVRAGCLSGGRIDIREQSFAIIMLQML